MAYNPGTDEADPAACPPCAGAGFVDADTSCPACGGSRRAGASETVRLLAEAARDRRLADANELASHLRRLAERMVQAAAEVHSLVAVADNRLEDEPLWGKLLEDTDAITEAMGDLARMVRPGPAPRGNG